MNEISLDILSNIDDEDFDNTTYNDSSDIKGLKDTIELLEYEELIYSKGDNVVKTYSDGGWVLTRGSKLTQKGLNSIE